MNNQFESRDYGYTVISRFEEVLRGVIANYTDIMSGEFVEYIPNGVIEAARSREEDITSIIDLLENIDFIHLKEIMIYKNNYEGIINSTILDVDSFVPIMDSLYGLRCKIAHIRNVFTNTDFNFLVDESLRINDALIERNDQFPLFVNSLINEPIGLIKKTPLEFFSDEIEILNNLPMADYEFEGGFVGRGDDVESLIKMMKTDRFHVITVAGAGGVGKSALVIKTVNEVLQRKLISYDFIVWVSAKENRLSYLGIEDIEPTLKDYDELLDTILGVTGLYNEEYENDTAKKEKDINTLFDSCERVLIVIDNLETITDDRIINFIIDYHPNVFFIITSRRGLGQVERRYDLKELKERDAIHLFRVICKEKGLDSLSRADEKTISKYVRKVYCYPLAIKWVLGQAAIGKDISSIIESIDEQSSDISRFCFEQVFSELNENARVILYVLCLQNEARPQGILKYISNLNEDVFGDTIQNLIILSLVLPEQRPNKESHEINSFYSLLPLTRGYVKAQLDRDGETRARIQERMITVENTLEEADRARVQYRYSLSNYGAITEEEKLAAVLAQTAYQKHQMGSYDDAVEFFKRAINIAPSFAPIYRNWAMIESMEQHWSDADELMNKASKLSPEDPQIWLVWGNIKRKSERIKEAYTFYEKALKLSPHDNTVLNAYAQTVSRMGDYERADELFKEALGLFEGVSHTKHLIINHSSIAENLRKWSESLYNDRNYNSALEKLSEAKESIEIVLDIDNEDAKAKDTYANICIMQGRIYGKLGDIDSAISTYNCAIDCTDNSTRIKTLKLHARAVLQMIDLLIKDEKVNLAKECLQKEERQLKRIHDTVIGDQYKRIKEKLQDVQLIHGRIATVNYEKKYMVIESAPDYTDRYLGFFNECKEFISRDEDYINQEVAFAPAEEGDKKLAKGIIFV